MAVENGDPWIVEVAARDRWPSCGASGIAVDDRSREGRPGLAAAAAADSYDMALVTRRASPFQSTTAAWYSDGQGQVGVGRTAGLEPVRRSPGRPAVRRRRPRSSTR